VNLHFHCVFIEGVYLDRAAAGLKPRFVLGCLKMATEAQFSCPGFGPR
jgi:hypothetical protein